MSLLRPCHRRIAILAMLVAAAVSAQAAGPEAATVPAVVTTACATSRSVSTDHRVTYFRHCPDTPEMVAFRGGAVKIGDAAGNGLQYELPVHTVTLAPFAIGRYEVTRGEWRACMAAGGCTEPQKTPEPPESGDRYPISSVTWLQAKEFVAWLVKRTGKAYRLPSESEWEYAARAGETGSFTWDPTRADQVACQFANVLDSAGYVRHRELSWFVSCDDGYSETAPVGSFRPNAWGVYDMIGNVWEWVEDCWHPSYRGAPADGSAWLEAGCRKRVNRGGGWGSATGSLRLSNRDADPAGNFSSGLGFRVALTLARPN